MTLFKRRVLVTGANGFIGRHLCKALSENDAYVIGFVNGSTEPNSYLTDRYKVDITNRSQVLDIIGDIQPDMVIHLAASKNRCLDFSEYRFGYDLNLYGTLNVIEACHKSDRLKKFVSLGSCDEYGALPVPFLETNKEEPISAYGVSKLAVTNFMQAYTKASNFPWVILRPSIVYGPGQAADMFIPELIQTLLLGRKFEMTKGKQTRDFIYIDDLITAILLSMTQNLMSGDVINISSAKSVSIDLLARLIAGLIGFDMQKLLAMGARDYRPGDTMQYCASNDLACKVLGWKPLITLEEGLSNTISHYKSKLSRTNV